MRWAEIFIKPVGCERFVVRQACAGISFVTHDASLAGLGNAASPLGISFGGVLTVHLANGAVTAPKIANGTVVRSLNGLFDNLTLAAGANITITPAGNTLTIAAPNSLTTVAHDSTLTGNGTSGSPLGVANGGIGNAQLAENAVTSSKVANGAIGTAQLADNSVTFAKIAPNQVVTSLNTLTENVTLAAGSNITITPSGNTLTIAGLLVRALPIRPLRTSFTCWMLQAMTLYRSRSRRVAI